MSICICGCGKEIPFERHQKYNMPKYLKGHNNKYKNITIEDRIGKKIKKLGIDDCWEWGGAIGRNGYGYIRYQSRKASVHRLVYELTYGKIPNIIYEDGEFHMVKLLVCHHCDNPACCNPEHLFLGTDQDNMDDMHSKGRWHCSSRKNELNSNCKLTDIQINEIKKLYAISKYSYREIAKIYDITYGHIGKIITGKFRKP